MIRLEHSYRPADCMGFRPLKAAQNVGEAACLADVSAYEDLMALSAGKAPDA